MRPTGTTPTSGTPVPEAHDDLADALAQLTATGEILTAMGAFGPDLEAVLGAVVESARRLCRADAAQIYLLEDGAFRVAACRRRLRRLPRARGAAPAGRRPGTLSGRVAARPARPADRRRARRPGVRPAGRPAPRRASARSSACRCWSTTKSSASCRCGAARSTRSASAPSSWSRRSPRRPRSPSATSTWCGRCRAAPTSSPTRSSSSRRCGEVGHAVSSSLDLDEVLTTIVDPRGAALRHRRRVAARVRRRGARVPHPRRPTAPSPSCSRRCGGPASPWTARSSAGSAGTASRSSVADLERRRPRPAPAAPARRRLALAARRPDAARGRDRRRAGRPPAHARATSRPGHRRAAADLRQPVGAGDRQRAAVPRAGAQVRRSCRSRAGTSRSSWPACRHELRTPLNAVIGFSEVLLERMFGDLNERQDEYLRDILDVGPPPARAAQRHPGPVQGRGRPDGARAVDVLRRAARSSTAWPWSASERVAHGIALELEVDAGRRRHRGRRAALQAGRAQPAVQRGEVQPRRRPRSRCGPCATTTSCVVTVADNGHRHRAGGPGAHLRVVPAGRPLSRPERGHRPGADAVPADRRAVRRADVARQRGRASAARSASPSRCGDGAARDRGARRHGDAGPVVVVVEDDRASLELLTLYLEGAGVQVGGRPRRRRRAGGGAATTTRRPSCSTSGCPAWTAGRCSRRSRPTRPPRRLPVVVVTMLDERAAGACARAPPSTSSSRSAATTCSARCAASASCRPAP